MKPFDQHPIVIPIRLTAALRAMRRGRGLSQAAAGRLIGVTGKHIARIEANPGNARFDLFARYIGALGGRLRLVKAVPRLARALKKGPHD